VTKSISLEPADIAFKAQTIARRALSARIAVFLKEHWGDRWLEQLNELIERDNKAQIAKDPKWKPREPVLLGPNGPRWDNNAMLRALRDAVRTMPKLGPRARDIDRFADDLRRSRNKLAHEGEFSAADRNFAALYIKKSISLMEMIGGQTGIAELQQLKALLETSDELTIAAKGQDATNGPVERLEEFRTMLSMMEEVLTRISKEAPKEPSVPPDPQPPAAADQAKAPLAAKSSIAAAESTVRGRRKGPIPEPKAGLVLFPNVSEVSDAESDLGFIQANVYHSRSARSLSEIVGFDDPTRRNLYYKIVTDGRMNEADGATATLSTHARINPSDFAGASFGLAAVLADKVARYGLSDVLPGGHLIATGLVEPNGQGAIGAIDGFDAKVRLLDRDARHGSLFIFPQANLDKADQATNERLVRAAREGRYKWKAISHVEELSDLFAGSSTANSESPEPRLDALARNQPARSLDQSGSADSSPKPQHKAAAITASIGLGIALLAGVYAISEWRNRASVDPIVVQASDERLVRLVQAASTVRTPPDSASSCRDLLTVTSALTEVDRQRLLPVHVSALDVSDRCRAALADSSARWEQIRTFQKALAQGQTIDLDAAAAAHSALTPFDFSDAQSPEQKALLATFDTVLADRRQADFRWAALAESVRDWRANETSKAIDRVAVTFNQMKPADVAKADAGQRALLEAGQSALQLIAESDGRLLSLSQAALRLADGAAAADVDAVERALGGINPLDQARANREQAAAIDKAKLALRQSRFANVIRAASNYSRRPNRTTASELDNAVNTLSSLDHDGMTPEQSAAIDDAASAQLAIIESNKRIEAVQDAIATLNVAENGGKGLAAAFQALSAAVNDLTPFDQASDNATLRAAISRAKQVNDALAASDARIAEATKWAERAASLGSRVPIGVAQALQTARSELISLDYERLTVEQKTLLDSVCGISGPLAPGTLAPIDRCTN
jgi:hypothetical protein